jgi:hypothetical protein
MSGPVYLFVPFWGEAEATDLQCRYSDLSLIHDPEIDWTNSSDPDESARFLVADLAWAPTSYDQLLLDIANDAAPSMVFYSAARRAVFAPYDGGADVISASEAELHRHRAKWGAWLPKGEGGL